MNNISISEKITLLIGDIALLTVSLWITLLIRFVEMPSFSLFRDHLILFIFLFIAWIVVFIISGLYGKHTSLFKKNLPKTIVSAQIINISLAFIYFYFIAPFFSLSPKTNLLIYLLVSTALLVLWRFSLFPLISKKKKDLAILVSSGQEAHELMEEVNGNTRYPFKFVSFYDTLEMEGKDIYQFVKRDILDKGVAFIVFDPSNEKIAPVLPEFYKMMFSNINFIDFEKLYESIFDRISLSSLDHGWFIQNISRERKTVYEFTKRMMDIFLGLILSLILLLVYPFVVLAIKIEDKGKILIFQERVGKDGNLIKIAKFRSMKVNDSGVWYNGDNSVITKVGKFLRRSRIDELPQLISVIKGDLSLIGPRPDIVGLGAELFEKIPYYAVRYTIKPGLSGWAQVMQGPPPQSIEETKMRLAYDFYYIKNYSIWLDLTIALKTIKTLFSRLGV